MPCRCQRRQRIVDVVPAGKLPLHHALHLAVEDHFEARAVGAEQPGLPLATLAGGLHRCPAAHADDALERRFRLGMDDQPLARHGAHQVMELPLDGGKVRKDICVIELQIVQDRGARAVVDELAALVEEGAVVFVGFHHEERRTAQARGDAEVLRHTTDEKTRAHAGMFEHPGQHAAGGGLAMGTGGGQHPAPLQHVIGQPLRAGDIGQALVQHVFDCRVATRQGVAHHHQFGCRFQMRRLVALHQFDALRLELRAHRRIDVGVGAGDAMAEFLGQHRERAHEGAADTENMDMHG